MQPSPSGRPDTAGIQKGGSKYIYTSNIVTLLYRPVR